jgi:diguanylate cyclase (GGDEF)-like protein
MSRTYREKIKKLLKRQRLLNDEILMYRRVMEGMRQGLVFENLLKLIIDSVRKGMGFKRAGIFLVEPDGKHFHLALGIGGNGKYEHNKDRLPLDSKPGKVPLADVINGRVSYFLCNNIPDRIPLRYHYRVEVINNAVVPIQVGKEKTIGALAVDNLRLNRPITKSDVSSLMNYATQLGLAIESLRIHEKAMNLSLIDPLTELYNRRHFDKALAQEIKRCQRYKRAFSILLIDIDHFKRINDKYGHDAGDRVIRQVGNLLRNTLRNPDVVGRVGGEEFAVILPETPPQSITLVVKRLLKEMRGTIPDVPVMAEKNEKVTFSIGLATYLKGSATGQTIMKLADQSMYQAKRNGRNRAGKLKVIRGKS